MNGRSTSGDMVMGLAIGTFVGAAVGAGLALLLAPRTGRESRDWLARTSRQIKDRVVGALEESKEAVQNGIIPS